MLKMKSKRVKPSTDLLDRDDVVMPESTRRVFSHQRIGEDKSAPSGQLVETSRQLADAIQRQVSEQAELAGLEKARALLTVDHKPVKELSDKIRKLQESVETMPSVIAVLKERVAAAVEQQRKQNMDALLNEQKQASSQMEKSSVELVALLEKAVNVNLAFKTAERRYCDLKKLTGVDTVSTRVCRGSDGSLQLLAETCKAEYEGKRGMTRQPPRPGAIPL